MESKFIHKVSKGSRFNQIYIPKEYEQIFQKGDIVEIRLVEKKVNLYYSKNLKKLSEFKEKLIKDIFLEISKFKEVDQVFIFGSFLTKKADYNDIDIFVVSANEEIDKQVHVSLTEKLNMKFHVIALNEENLKHQLKISPVIRSMFYYFISNKQFLVPKDKEIEVNHIKSLLMFPEDLLNVELESESFYEALRRIICISQFLLNKEIAPDKIDEIIKKQIDNNLLERIKNNKKLRSKSMKELRKVIKIKLKEINSMLKNGKKRQHKGINKSFN